MREFALEHVGDDLHVAVRMGRKPGRGRHAVIVDHTQRTVTHPLGIVVMIEGKGETALQPVQVGDSTLIGRSLVDHGYLLSSTSSNKRYDERDRHLVANPPDDPAAARQSLIAPPSPCHTLSFRDRPP